MSIKAREVIGNRVVTQSGQSLGRVVDFEIDTISQNIIRYYTQGDLLGFLKEPLIINANQVIEIKKDKIIVEDMVVSEKVTKKKTTPNIEYVR
jgi:sporulation protein YlmC with PRC-barrel domain